MEQVKLIGAFPSPFVYRVIWALKLKGVEYEYLEESMFDLLLNKSQTSVIHYNPVYKKVPVLVHGGKPIAESIVILEYIEDKWPQTYPLLPHDPYERAMARFWTKFGEDKMPILCGTFFATANEQQEKAAEARQVLKILEEQGLGEKKFFGGNELGMADVALGWLANWLEVIDEAAGVKVMADADEFPRLKAWMENFKKFPVIKENLPDRDKMLSYFKHRREMHISSVTA